MKAPRKSDRHNGPSEIRSRHPPPDDTLAGEDYSRLIGSKPVGSGPVGLGIGVHLTAPTIHCGFIGPIQLEIINTGPNEIILDAGIRVCELIFELTTGIPETGYQGLFLNQTPPKAN
jgi:hypothetical protein